MKIWKCTVCGWLHEGEHPPANCPRCGAPAEKFELVDLDLLELELNDEDVATPAPKELTQEDKDRIQPALFRISYGLFVVGSVKGDKVNAQTCNTVFQITSTPMRVVVGINKDNLSNEYIKASGVFTVCILGHDDAEMVGAFGYRSGREVDKLANVAYKTGVTGAPVIKQCLAYLECRVLDEYTVEVGTHTMFVGEVIEGGVTKEGEPMTYAFYRQQKKAPAKTTATKQAKPKADEPKSAETKNDETQSKQWRCKVCGYIHTGDTPPDICPVCGAPKEEFELV